MARRLEVLRREARRALQRELRDGQPGNELVRRARDYRSWHLMQDYPARIPRLVTAMLTAEGASSGEAIDSGTCHELCVQMTALLAELCDEAAAGHRPPSDPQGQ